MRRFAALTVIVAAGLLGGCAKKEITPLQRKQAATLVSEASFAVTVRDLPRAESLLAQATALCPDSPEYWVNLGTVRRRMDNRAGAKTALEEGLKASRDAYKRDDKEPAPLLQQVYILAMLGRVDDARSTLEKAQKKHPDDRAVRMFVENKQLDRMLADPGFKELSL
jgi:tetratricopeptide (TPR) repeat protein